jgi:gamma-glutamyltranspeptidase
VATRSPRAGCRSSQCPRSSPPTRTVAALEHGLPVQQAVDLPRVHSQGEDTYVDSRVDPEILAGLRERGHRLVVQDVTPGELAFSRVSAVAASADGTLTAAAGPSWNTAAGGV